MKSSRYTEIPFPSYAYLPGRHPHPLKSGGHMEETGEPEVPPMDFKRPKESTAYLYAIDLFNHGFYWESHVWWEALWHHTGRKGESSDFLKALIKLAAAGVKWKVGQQRAAKGHCTRALELLLFIQKEHSSYAGLDLDKLVSMAKSTLLDNFYLKIE